VVGPVEAQAVTSATTTEGVQPLQPAPGRQMEPDQIAKASVQLPHRSRLAARSRYSATRNLSAAVRVGVNFHDCRGRDAYVVAVQIEAVVGIHHRDTSVAPCEALSVGPYFHPGISP